MRVEGVGNFWSHGLDKSWEDLSLRGQDPPLIVLWPLLPPYVSPAPGFATRSTSLSHHLGPSLILLLDPFARTMGGGLVISHSHLGTSIFLLSVPPFPILGLTFNPLKEGSTDKCYVLMNSIVWDLSPLVQGTSQFWGDERGLSYGGSNFWKAQPLLPKCFTASAHLSLYLMSLQ